MSAILDPIEERGAKVLLGKAPWKSEGELRPAPDHCVTTPSFQARELRRSVYRCPPPVWP